MRNCLIFILLLLIGCQEREPSFLKLHGYIGNHAVFQRNEPITIRGQSSPNTRISGSLGKRKASTNSNNEGNFILTFTSLEAQTGLTLEIESSDSTAIFNDIAIGDVWFASGQSNMEWPLQKTDNSNEVIQSSNLPKVRFFKTPKTIEFVSIDSLREEVNWIKGDEKEIGDISGVAYYFARKIHQETNVPIGVVVSSWGGTRIESWMSDKAIGAFDNLVEEKKSIAQIDKSIAEIEAFNKQILDDFLNEVFPKGIGMDEKWYLPQEYLSDWKEIHVPGYWEDQVPEYSSFDGAMWYRRKFDLQPEHYQNGDIRMWLSQIDDHNQVWINGEFIGETYYKDSWTNYLIPQEVLKEKDNEIVMRVFDIGGKGGTTGLENYFDFYLEGDNKIRGRLNGTWLSKAGVSYQDTGRFQLELAKVEPNHFPSMLFNGMVQPFLNFPIKGVIWYQGEQNKSNAYQYRSFFPAMIKDWRTAFNNEKLPFYFAQIANFGAIASEPEESGGAELREAQFMTLSLPNTGMACTIDIGEADDVHPTNKKDVGERLARHALQNEYGFDLVTDGPIYKSHVVEGDKVIISFENAEGLKTVDNQNPKGFVIASENSSFQWAEAEIKGDKIVLKSKKVKEPVHIRYGWAEAPLLNLYNAEDLPMYPFRTDTRKGVSCCE